MPVGLVHIVLTWNKKDRMKNKIFNYLVDVFMILFGYPFFVIPMTLLNLLKSI